MKIHLSRHQADELVRLIDEEEKIDEEAMQEIKREILDHPHRPHVREKDLKTLLEMLPASAHDLHQLISHNCVPKKVKGKLTDDCLLCELSEKREKAVRRLREALGMPLGGKP